MKYKWAIPSYNRADDPLTVNLLHDLGYEKTEIIVSTQSKKDYKEYCEKQGHLATVIYREGTNDSMNRNTLLLNFPSGTPFILADDDIKAFCKLSADGKTLQKITNRVQLERYFDMMFKYCVKNNSRMWAWYPVENAFFMKHTIDDKNILVGTILGIINSRKYMFDENFSLKGDFEISLRQINDGLNAIRFNGFTCIAKHKSKGGCEEARKRGENEGRYKELLRRYPNLVVPSKREGEIKYIGKVTHSPEKDMLL